MWEGRRLSFAVVHAESDFKAELSAGDAIRIETEIMAIGSKSLTFRHRLLRVYDNVVAFETKFKYVMLNLETRGAVQIPDAVREKATVWLIDGQD
jgi:acyl-CoA thioester hydrolase